MPFRFGDQLPSTFRVACDTPAAGQRFTFSQDFAGLGGDVKYIRTRLEGSKYKSLGGGFIGSIVAEGG